MQNLDEKTILQYLNIGSTIAAVAGWAIPSALDLPGKNMKFFGPDGTVPINLIAPSGYAFSIWFPIYALVAVFLGYQALLSCS